MPFENNLRAASQAIGLVRFFCSYGAANKPGEVAATKKGSWSPTTGLNSALAEVYDLLEVDMMERKLQIPIDAALGRMFRTGTCETQASLAFEHLKKLKTPRPIDFMVTANLSHAFVVIGRAGAAETSRVGDWGDEAAVCDPWLNEDPGTGPNTLNAEWAKYPYKPDAWGACDLVLGAQSPQKLSSYTFKSQYRLET